MVIHDFIADVREYAESPDDNRVSNSIAFQMGLVFRFKGTAPEWLQENAQQGPTISQRRGADSREASTAEADFRQVRTFNIVRTDFPKIRLNSRGYNNLPMPILLPLPGIWFGKAI
jgi:hypothetical protein